MFRYLIAAAREHHMLYDDAIVAATKWQDWLHPRGKDGRFIEVFSAVNVFADPNDLLSDSTAVRRRATIRELRPEGAFVTYQDAKGNEIPADPAAGFPDEIPIGELADKVSTAPKAIAYLNKGLSAQEEFDATFKPAMTQGEYDQAIAEINDYIRQTDPQAIADVMPGQPPMTDEQFAAHNEFVTRQSAFALHPPSTNPDDPKSRGLAYDAAFKDSNGLWSEEWQLIFDNMVEEAYQEVTKNGTMPRDKRAIMLGGLPGAGKTSVLNELAKTRVFREEEWITTNPDTFKDRMIAKGLFPKLEGFAPAETAAFIHAASSEMNWMLESALSVEGFNLIFDITMGGRKRTSGVLGHEASLNRLESLDYQVDGIFVDVSPNTSRTRVVKRHRNGMDKLRTGVSTKGPEDPAIKFGGRTVPNEVIDHNVIEAGDTASLNAGFVSHNAKNFAELKDKFTRWGSFDNNENQAVWQGGSATSPADRDNMPGYYAPAPIAAPAPAGAPA